jgi:hypothetical protein
VKRFLLSLGLLLLPAAAGAQVVVNPAALAQLAGILPPAPVVAKPHLSHRTEMIRSAYRAGRPVARPVAKPLVATVAKPVPVPVVAKPAPVLVAPVAIDFASGSDVLPAGAAASLRQLCRQPTGFIMINATAPADPDDRSVAMRLSMDRAFAVRDALTACGIASTRILPRALGDASPLTPDTTQVSLLK